MDSTGARSIAARRGVVLATGGFSYDADLRERFFPGAAGSVSATSPAGTGDGLRLAIEGGADIGTRVADPAYWCLPHCFDAPMAVKAFFRIP